MSGNEMTTIEAVFQYNSPTIEPLDNAPIPNHGAHRISLPLSAIETIETGGNSNVLNVISRVLSGLNTEITPIVTQFEPLPPFQGWISDEPIPFDANMVIRTGDMLSPCVAIVLVPEGHTADEVPEEDRYENYVILTAMADEMKARMFLNEEQNATWKSALLLVYTNGKLLFLVGEFSAAYLDMIQQRPATPENAPSFRGYSGNLTTKGDFIKALQLIVEVGVQMLKLEYS